MTRQRTAPVRIIVDSHEHESGIALFLAEFGVEIEIASLPAGDYAVGEHALVERKRVRDLHATIIKGRLWAQIGKLRSASLFPYLLIEGTDLDRGPLHPHSVRGACLAVIDLGVPVIRSDTQRDSALWLHRLAIRCQRSQEPPDRPVYSQRPKPPPEQTAEAMLTVVPGISTTSARALLTRFGTVAGVLAATEEEWRTVPGIGKDRARLLAETLRSPLASPMIPRQRNPST